MLDEGDEFEARQIANAARNQKKKKKDGLTRDTIGLGHPSYWEVRYAEELEEMVGKIDTFDWYCEFEHAWDMIANFIDEHANHKILLLGVGRSKVVEYLYKKKGFRDITAMDISPSVIKRMQDKYAHLTGVEFICMDVCEMLTLKSDTYSIVIDKGCIDSLFCSTSFTTVVPKALNEVRRVLSMEGIFFCVSHATPLSRVPYFRAHSWAIEISKMVEGESLTLFALTKTDDAARLDKKIVGAEAGIIKKNSALVSSLDQKMNKSSTTRNKANAGALTVTASLDRMIEMVDETRDVDGDGTEEELFLSNMKLKDPIGGAGLKVSSLKQNVAAVVESARAAARLKAEARIEIEALERSRAKLSSLENDNDDDAEDIDM